MSDQLEKSPRFKPWVSSFSVDSVPVMPNVSPILTSHLWYFIHNMKRGLCQFWGHELKGELSAVLSRGTSDEKKENAESKGQYFLAIFAFVLKCLSRLEKSGQTAGELDIRV